MPTDIDKAYIKYIIYFIYIILHYIIYIYTHIYIYNICYAMRARRRLNC